MTTLPYLLTASLYLLLFYGCYGLFLRRNTFFSLNRAYLLVSVLFSLVLPLLELPGGAANQLPVGTITLPAFSVGTLQPAQSSGLTTEQWLWLLYGLGVVAMLVRLGLNLRAVFRLIQHGTVELKSAFTLVRLPDNSTPSFSFGRYLVLNSADSLTEPDALIRHEAAHIRQRHTLDVIFMEVVQAAFWFNPVVWFYKRALQIVHEFLADRAAVQRAVAFGAAPELATLKPAYARQLVAYALDVPATALTTPFVSKSSLKQRIVMLQKPQTHRRALLGYALALPLAAVLVMCTQPDRDQPQTEIEAAVAVQRNAARTPVNVDGEVFTVVEHQPEFKDGMAALGEYMQKSLKYPAAAQRANIQGRVFVSFIVTKTGEVTDVKLLKGLGFGIDEEAIQVVQNMPRWTPAKQSGKVVNVRFNLPINFTLEDNLEETSVGGNSGSLPFLPPKLSDEVALQKQFSHFFVNGNEVDFNELGLTQTGEKG